MHSLYILLLSTICIPVMIALGQASSGGVMAGYPGNVGMGGSSPDNTYPTAAWSAKPVEHNSEGTPTDSRAPGRGNQSCNILTTDENMNLVCAAERMKQFEAKDIAEYRKVHVAAEMAQTNVAYQANLLSQIPAPPSMRLDELMDHAKLALIGTIPLNARSAGTVVMDAPPAKQVQSCILKHQITDRVTFLRPSSLSGNSDGTLILGAPISLSGDGSWIRIPVQGSNLTEIECKSSDGSPVMVGDVTRLLSAGMLDPPPVPGVAANGTIKVVIYLPPEQISRNINGTPSLNGKHDKPGLPDSAIDPASGSDDLSRRAH